MCLTLERSVVVELGEGEQPCSVRWMSGLELDDEKEVPV